MSTVPGHLRQQLGVSAPNRHFDVVLMGRATYEVGLELGVTSPYPHLEQYLFSRTMERSPSEAVTLVSENAVPQVRELKKRGGRDIWLCGGGKLASALVDEIDELILKVNPVILGAGRPLFAGPGKERALALVEHRTWENGFALLRYRTQSGTGNPPSD
jgi:dihydrofolate reductase